MSRRALKDPLEPFRADSDIFSKLWPDYEHRPQQEQMAEHVSRALQEQKILLVEAGTGTGKTMAYLLPLLHHALENKVRVAISTETRALQKQILEKDVPMLRKILGRDIRAEVCFGSSNYVCKRKLERVVDQGDFGPDMQDHLSDFLDWEAETAEGTRFDYDGFASRDFWNRVTREPDNCLARRCPHYDESFIFMARNRWKDAHLLILNHSLLASHLAMEGKLLPEFEAVVIDEAHRFPEIFAGSFHENMSLGEIFSLFKNLGSRVGTLQDDLEDFHAQFIAQVDLYPGQSKRLREALEIPDGDSFVRGLRDLKSKLDQEYEKMDLAHASLFEGEAGESETLDEEKLRLNMHLGRLDNHVRILEKLFQGPDKDYVHWLSRSERDRKNYYELTIAPIFSGDSVRAELLDSFSTVVFTSATLTASGSNPFGYFMNEIGLISPDEPAERRGSSTDENMDDGPQSPETAKGDSGDAEDAEPADEGESEEEDNADYGPVRERVFTARLDSPFDYASRAILYLPRNVADPAKEEEEFHEHAALLIRHLVNLSGGGAFVLFTSNRSLRTVHEMLVEDEELDPDLELQSQPELGPGPALKAFQATDQGVLLGLATFWQGIDVPGDKLRLVILVRLPFRVPDDPALEARMELEKSRGAKPFFSIQLPQATITLKQGFGRLIRGARDRGAVCIIDPRMTTRGYGRDILGALPRASVVRKFADLKAAYLNLFEQSH